MKKAPEYMNDVVKNVQEELVEIDLNNGEGEENECEYNFVANLSSVFWCMRNLRLAYEL